MKIFWEIAILSYAYKGAHIFWGRSIYLPTYPSIYPHPPAPPKKNKEELYMYPWILVSPISVFDHL